MNRPPDEHAIWYHGSDARFDVLRTGSTVTRWKRLAEAFSHRPTWLSTDDSGQIRHNGCAPGFLYRVDELAHIGVDLTPHPRTTMDAGVEYLTCRPLRVLLIGNTGGG